MASSPILSVFLLNTTSDDWQFSTSFRDGSRSPQLGEADEQLVLHS